MEDKLYIASTVIKEIRVELPNSTTNQRKFGTPIYKFINEITKFLPLN